MTAEVRAELDRLLVYASAAGQEAARHPDRDDLLDGVRGYLGGALTTLLHLRLLTEEEYAEWLHRLNEPLPPVEWIGG